ncbi:penicillin-binding protein 2 [Fructilactobacillus vespulae]|uniref:peptidoglycan D,D-transpeptidase FtsI family protein n=1 Tax=Fructilactobacillus vespulae TaxID=1249630 RepID=UPI0039B4664D
MGNFFGKFFKRRTRSSRQKSEANVIPFRLNLIFIIVGLLFVVLIWKLADLQIIQGKYFQSVVNNSNNATKYGNVERGMIYDSTGKLISGNQAQRAITYTRLPNVNPSDMYDDATKLGSYIKVPTKKLTDRQIADYYLANPTNSKNVAKTIKNYENMSVDNQQTAKLKKVMNGGVISFNDKIKNNAAIYNSMSGAYKLSTTFVKYNDVSNEEMSLVGEHASEMPGVAVGTNWARNYPDGENIKMLTGGVSSNEAGLPENEVNKLLAQGYSQNESVGTSNLESKYEPILKGSKSQTNVKMNSDGQIISQVKKYAGKRGDNLQLTVNSKFQKDLEDLVKSNQAGGNATGTYAVAMNPKTGAVIGMAGVDRDPKTGKVTENDLGTMATSITMGSVVKGATVAGALMDKVITPESSVLTDMPIKNGGGTKSSWFNKNGEANMAVNAAGALEVSSNSYMMQLAMKEANFHYVEGGQLNMNPAVFNTLRSYFNQFGLGIKTGIDIPGESKGIQGPGGFANIGKALDESYGNYDGYTTMQLAQYMSTIANGGYRLQPYLVQNIRETNEKNGKLGRIKNSTKPRVLNKVPISTEQLDVIKQGFYQVVHGSNKYKTGGALQDISPEVSAKTGTAQTFYNGQETVTLSLVSYAPSDDPQVVIALAMPNLPADASVNNTTLAKQIYQAYWKDVQNAPGK